MTLQELKKSMNRSTLMLAFGLALGLILGASLVAAWFAANESGSKYKSRAIRAEMRVQLIAAFAAEKVWEQENGYFVTDLEALGIEPDGRLRYKFGFTKPTQLTMEQTASTSTDIDLDPDIKDTDALEVRYHAKAPQESFQTLAQRYCPECTADVDGFKLVAIGKIDDSLDVWTIDQDKNLVHLVGDAKE